MEYLRKKLGGFSREDISAGVQKHLEDIVTAYIKGLVLRYAPPCIPVVFAGGVFANVRLNQRIKELPEVSGVYICPHMMGGRLAAGYTFAYEVTRKKFLPQPLADAHLNASFNMHEEPIACTPQDTLRTFLQGNLAV